jgi:Tol biopolymer transport system component
MRFGAAALAVGVVSVAVSGFGGRGTPTFRAAQQRVAASEHSNGLLAIGDPTGNEIDVVGVRGLRRLINYANSPAWSPDGRRLAYVGSYLNPRTDNYEGRLYLAKAIGGDRRRLPVNFPVGSEVGSDISWSPDGRKLVFDGGPGGEDHIYVIDADGSGLRQLTHGHEDDTPAWSPAGNTIAFVRGVSTFDIYLMNPDGSDQRKLTMGDSPAWSPHGTVLAFVRAPGGAQAPSLYVIAPGHSGGAQRFGVGTAPAWSPDGKQLAFFCCSGYLEPANGIYSVNVNQGRPRRLTTYPAGPVSLNWQPRPR